MRPPGHPPFCISQDLSVLAIRCFGPAESDGSDLPAVIYIKHRVNRAWTQTEQFAGEYIIPEDEKARVRDRLVPILAASEGGVRQQLIPVLQRILQCDFPAQWPRFMDFTSELLNTNSPSSVLAGLQCLLAICRAFRYKSHDNQDRAQFDLIVENSFPRLLAICSELVNQESDDAGEMLHLALKSYKHATWVSYAAPGRWIYRELSQSPPCCLCRMWPFQLMFQQIELSNHLRQQQVNIAWCTVFLQTVSKAAPASAMQGDSTDRERNHWWKAKKWAFFNLNRLFIRSVVIKGAPKHRHRVLITVK